MSLLLAFCDARAELGDRWETTNIQIAYNTPLEVFEEIRGRIKAYVTENSRDWSGMDFNIDKMEYQNAIHIIVAMERMSSSLSTPPSFFLC